MLLDLDKFKLVNDTYGHEIGDKLLIEFAQRLREVMRDNDTIAHAMRGTTGQSTFPINFHRISTGPTAVAASSRVASRPVWLSVLAI